MTLPRLLCVAATALCALGAFGQAVVVVKSFEGDARLATPISLHLKNALLGHALSEIAKQTGVQISAHRDIAEDGCAIFVKAKPAGHTLGRIAANLEYEWERRGEAPNYRYTLVMPGRTRTKMLALKNRERRAQLAWMQTHIDAIRPHLVQGYPAVAQERARLRAEADATPDRGRQSEIARQLNGPLALLHDLPTYATAYVVASLTPKQWTALQDGETLTAATTPGRQIQLPPAFSAWLAAESESAAQETSRRGPRPPDPIFRQSSYSAGMRMNLRWIDGAGVEASVQFRTEIRDGDEAKVVRSARSVRWPTIHLAEKPRAQLDWSPDLIELRQDADLAASKIAGRPTQSNVRTFADALERLAALTEFGIISDTYWLPTDASFAAQNLRDAAMQLAQSGKADVKRDGEFLMFRSAFWFENRFREIPVALLDRLAAAQKSRGLSLDDVAEIAALTRDQVENLRANRLALREKLTLDKLSEWLALPAFDALRFYSSLPAAQRQTLRSGRGLPLAAMSPKSQALTIAIMDSDASGSIADDMRPDSIGVLLMGDTSAGIHPGLSIHSFSFWASDREVKRVRVDIPRKAPSAK